MKNKMLIALLLVSLLAVGCTTFKATGIAPMSSGDSRTTLGTFHTTVWVNGFLGASAGAKLFNISSDATDDAVIDAINEEVRRLGGSAAVNVSIEYRASILHLFLNNLTWAIWAPSEVEISGTAVK